MLEYIERHEGIEALFDIRELESNVSFLRNYLIRDLADEMDLFLYRRDQGVYRVTNKDVASIRDTLIRQRTNGGYPYLTAMDDDYGGRGGLLLLHRYEGLELDRRYVERTLPLVHRLWGRPVHLKTQNKDNKKLLYSYDGHQMQTA
ncbi:SpoVR family protein [Paenibacillus tarimensis]